jgi:hypothetical protein
VRTVLSTMLITSTWTSPAGTSSHTPQRPQVRRICRLPQRRHLWGSEIIFTSFLCVRDGPVLRSRALVRLGPGRGPPSLHLCFLTGCSGPLRGSLLKGDSSPAATVVVGNEFGFRVPGSSPLTEPQLQLRERQFPTLTVYSVASGSSQASPGPGS